MPIAPASASPLETILCRAKRLHPVDAAIAGPYDDLALSGALAAQREGLIRPLLVGEASIIASAMRRLEAQLPDMQIIDTQPGTEAATAARLAFGGAAKILVKGTLHSEVLLHRVLHEAALRDGARLSHVVVTELPGRETPVLLSDGAVTIEPTLDDKVQIVQNAIDIALQLGLECPRVALLAAVETIEAKMTATVDAAALTEMARRAQIQGAMLDGPLALDDALSPRAATAKNLKSPAAGRADILISPNLEAGNMLFKAFDALLNARFAAIVTGASVPIVFTSRGDSTEARVFSTALARLLVAA